MQLNVVSDPLLAADVGYTRHSNRINRSFHVSVTTAAVVTETWNDCLVLNQASITTLHNFLCLEQMGLLGEFMVPYNLHFSFSVSLKHYIASKNAKSKNITQSTAVNQMEKAAKSVTPVNIIREKY